MAPFAVVAVGFVFLLDKLAWNTKRPMLENTTRAIVNFFTLVVLVYLIMVLLTWQDKGAPARNANQSPLFVFFCIAFAAYEAVFLVNAIKKLLERRVGPASPAKTLPALWQSIAGSIIVPVMALGA
ncbi:MAG: hypothetical protein WB992_18360 [Bryobacteraceae bacterium]